MSISPLCSTNSVLPSNRIHPKEPPLQQEEMARYSKENQTKIQSECGKKRSRAGESWMGRAFSRLITPLT